MQVVSSSIEFVIENIDHNNIQAADLPPMMEIKLGLYNKDVLFNAKDIHIAGANPDIWAMVILQPLNFLSWLTFSL
jgi:hypothetical protein